MFGLLLIPGGAFRRLMFGVAGSALAVSMTGACTSGGAPRATGGDGSSVSVPPQSLPEASSDAVAVVESADLALDEGVALCVAGRLDDSPALREGLGSDARSSPRLGEFLELVDGCRVATVWANRFAETVQTSAGGELSGEQLGCVRDAVGGLTPEVVSGLLDAGVFRPGEAPADSVLEELLAGCGVAMDALAGPAP